MKFHPQEINPDPFDEKIKEIKKHLSEAIQQYVGMPTHPSTGVLDTIERQALAYIAREIPGAEKYTAAHVFFDPQTGNVELQIRFKTSAPRIKFLREVDDTRLGKTFKEIP